jgi:hypothetical protein
MEVFKIIIRHRSDVLDSPTATVCDLPEGISFDRASEILNEYFSKYEDDDIAVELWKSEAIVH